MMRVSICAIVFMFAAGANAQLIPVGLQESIDNLTVSINSLKAILNITNGDVKTFAPQIVSAGNSVGSQISALSSSANNIYDLGNANLPAAQDSLSKAANALQVLGNFSTTAQNNVTPIAFAAIGVIAAGIVLGQGIFFGIKFVVKTMRAHHALNQVRAEV